MFFRYFWIFFWKFIKTWVKNWVATTCNKKTETQAVCFKFFCRSVFCFPFRSADLELGLVHAPPTGQTYGWLDRRFLLSSFISTPAVSPTTAMAGRLAPLKSRFSAPLPFLGCLSGGFVEAGEQGGWVMVEDRPGFCERGKICGREGVGLWK